MLKIFFVFAAALLLFPQAAHAYIDPGTGILVLQMLAAAAATALVTIKMWWARFISLFKKGEKSEKDDQGGDAQG